ncbi:metal-dependent hydrolase [Zobellia alginiliquefaciens]|uniref:metal-dependent hydrolase n=1 Tax=Zobellia alginiliquefaciens TaxID=3032586 RepID=UPI0023E35D10|nr:metal-dependent hydrolase [Zobellia alginiliquefaciens]
MKITHYGQNSLSIEIGSQTIIVDPFITQNELSKDKVDIMQLKADYIFLTHAHFDHILDAEAIAKNTGATIVSNFEIYKYYDEKGLDAMPMNHGGSRTFDFGKVKYVNAIHTSSFPDGSYGGNPGGFVFSAEGKTIYISGDTALTMDMKLLPLQFEIDLAILPIGDVVTMGINDAVLASDFVGCNRVLGVHYDALPFTKINHEEAKQTFKKVGKELILLEVGETMSV